MSNKATQFQPGNKLGGRKPGSKNRSTAEIREFIQNVVDDNMETLQEDLNNMSPFMRRKTIADLIKYFLPTMSQNSNHNTGEVINKIVVEYVDVTSPIQAELPESIAPIQLAFSPPAMLEQFVNQEDT